jgi:hypothetical protein
VSTPPDTVHASVEALYPYHRECVECGYDIFHLQTSGLCPECGKPVARTATLPLWQAGSPSRLDVSRDGLRVAAGVAVATQVAAGFAYVGAASFPGDFPFVFFLPSLIVGPFYLVALLALAAGVGRSAWKRWLPFSLFVVSAGVAAAFANLPAYYSHHAWLNAALIFTAIWLVGRAHAAHIEEIGTGMPRRVTQLRARRFATITRYVLLVPPVLIWTFGSTVSFFGAPIAMFNIAGPAKLAAAIVLVWLLISMGYWLMIARDCKPLTARQLNA